MGKFICQNPSCAKQFVSKHSVAKYCSRKCSNTVNSSNIIGAKRPTKFSNAELLDMLQSLAKQIGSTPSQRDCDLNLPITSGVFRDRFGSYNNAVRIIGLKPNDQSSRKTAVASRKTRASKDKISPKTRFEILSRDGFRCQYCGATPQDGAILEVDHIIPVSKGGSREKENLKTSCRQCNIGKGAK